MRRAFLDANVLFPTVQREMFLEVARLYQPLWSEKVLDEWYFSVLGKLGPEAAAIAKAEILAIRERFPHAAVPEGGTVPGTQDRLDFLATITLPDASDRHVIVSAIRGAADFIVTSNRKDFPRRTMDALGLRAISPDEFIALLMAQAPQDVLNGARNVVLRAQAAGGEISASALFKRARLPRLAKAVARQSDQNMTRADAIRRPTRN